MHSSSVEGRAAMEELATALVCPSDRRTGSLLAIDEAIRDLLDVLEDMTMLETNLNRRISILGDHDIGRHMTIRSGASGSDRAN